MIEIDRGEVPTSRFFSAEVGSLLESTGAKILLIGDQSLASLRNNGFKYRFSEISGLMYATSVVQEVAIWLDAQHFFHTGSFFSNYEDQQRVLSVANRKLHEHATGISFVRGSAADWAHVTALMEREGVGFLAGTFITG